MGHIEKLALLQAVSEQTQARQGWGTKRSRKQPKVFCPECKRWVSFYKMVNRGGHGAIHRGMFWPAKRCHDCRAKLTGKKKGK